MPKDNTPIISALERLAIARFWVEALEAGVVVPGSPSSDEASTELADATRHIKALSGAQLSGSQQ